MLKKLFVALLGLLATVIWLPGNCALPAIPRYAPIPERGLAFEGDDENVESSRNFFKHIFIKEDAMFLVTGFATVSYITTHYTVSSCFKKFVTVELTYAT